MQATPLFLGACALVSVAGMVSGTSIDTNPIQRGGIGMNEITRPTINFNAELSDQPSLPDHYAMNTPEGQIEVAELTTRGLYAQRRFGWRETTWSPPPVPEYDDSEPLPEPVDFTSENAADAAVEVAAVAQAFVQDQPVSVPVPVGEPRLIDVDQALAGG